jgi:hypothetical protein
MTQVLISYNPDLSKIGTVVDVDPDEARLLVSEGRGTLLPTGTKAELLEQAEAAGVDVPSSATKADVAAAIAAGQ